MCLKSQKLWEVEVGLSWVQSPLCKAEANSNWFIHAFIQQTLVEHLLYAKHYSSDGGYCDNTEKNIYSTGTSYHGERIRQQTKYSHVFGLSLLMMAWHSVMQWQLCWLNRGYRIHLERGSITRWRWCWLLAGSSARVVSCGFKFFSMRAWLVELPHSMAAESSMGISREPGGSVWYCDDLAWYFYDLVSPPLQSQACSDSRGGNISLLG